MSKDKLDKAVLAAIAAGFPLLGSLGALFWHREQQYRMEWNEKVWGTSHVYETEWDGKRMLLYDPIFLDVCWVMQGGNNKTHQHWPCENDYEWQDIDWGYEKRYD